MDIFGSCYCAYHSKVWFLRKSMIQDSLWISWLFILGQFLLEMYCLWVQKKPYWGKSHTMSLHLVEISSYFLYLNTVVAMWRLLHFHTLLELTYSLCKKTCKIFIEITIDLFVSLGRNDIFTMVFWYMSIIYLPFTYVFINSYKLCLVHMHLLLF